MGVKNICDRCGREVEFTDMHKITVVRMHDDKPSMMSKEICVWCKEELRPVIEGYKDADI